MNQKYLLIFFNVVKHQLSNYEFKLTDKEPIYRISKSFLLHTVIQNI